MSEQVDSTFANSPDGFLKKALHLLGLSEDEIYLLDFIISEFKSNREDHYFSITACIDSEKNYLLSPNLLPTDPRQDYRHFALISSRFRCRLCNSKTRLNTHHRTYRNLGREYPEDVIVLCNRFHKKFHNILAHPEEYER